MNRGFNLIVVLLLVLIHNLQGFSIGEYYHARSFFVLFPPHGKIEAQLFCDGHHDFYNLEDFIL